MASELFLLKPDHIPGDYGFDPDGLAKGKGRRLAGRHEDAGTEHRPSRDDRHRDMVAQELVQRVNLLPADFVVGVGGERRSERWKSDARTRRTKQRARRGVCGGGESRRRRRLVRLADSFAG